MSAGTRRSAALTLTALALRLGLGLGALAGGCASGPEPTRDGRPVDLDFSPETDADAAIAGLVTDLQRRDRQGWPDTVARSAPPRARPLVAILAVRNLTARSWDTLVIRGKLERALQDAGLAEVVSPEERRAVEGVPGRPLAITIDVSEERRSTDGGGTRVEYTVTITVVDQGSRRGVALVKDSVTKRRAG